MDEPEKFIPDEKDWLLSQIVSNANIGVEQSITLFVGGAVITGTVISGASFLKEAAAGIDGVKGLDPGLKEALKHGFTGWLPLYEKPQDASEEWSPPQTGYIHLRRAKFMAGSGLTRGMGSLWRGRLSKVDGFMLTSLTDS